MDRLAFVLGAKTFLPLVIPRVLELAQSPHWQYRYCAYMTLFAVTEGCASKLKWKPLEELLQYVYVHVHKSSC